MSTLETFKETCGIIMPISASEGYSAEHWQDVKNLLDEVIKNVGFESKLVSEADEIGIIHTRIVSNIYNNPLVICDVSSKNPNVMFELGLRLAFDKATIIIKDETTNYNFDTAPIEHLTYPKDLRYSVINKFKTKLLEKITATYEASKKSDYSTFLKNFVQYKKKLEEKEVSGQEFILKQLDIITKQLADIKTKNVFSRNYRVVSDYGNVISNFPKSETQMVTSKFKDYLSDIDITQKGVPKHRIINDFINEWNSTINNFYFKPEDLHLILEVVYDELLSLLIRIPENEK